MSGNSEQPKRPLFRPTQKANAHATPEALFYKLTGRAGSHAYLRGPQQDVLREYAESSMSAENVAFELPTGTGKTTVGLLIAEWKRLSDKRVAYLCLTNQLASQVLDEGQRLGIPCADLRGSREQRKPIEVGRFQTNKAIAVSTYANLFNINPVIEGCDALVLDDAHGAEQNVVDMWTVTVRRSEVNLYATLLNDMKPGLTASQLRAVLDRSGFSTVEMADVAGHPESLSAISETLDQAAADHNRFAWQLIKPRVHCCLFLVSGSEITIRPLIPPTHTHAAFAGAGQRIYMSATLGGESDLRRAYSVEALNIVRTTSPQWGRRYVFVPGVYSQEITSLRIAAAVWERMSTKRAVLLAPSEKVMTATTGALQKAMKTQPLLLKAPDIADSLEPFVRADPALLALAGRYDGLDLPDDDCRLLLMVETPAATNPLERHLRDRWKLGPVLRKRERTRLIQGMGRCTRSATDFSVILWLGQSLVNSATSTALRAGFPPELAGELQWGLEQSQMAGTDKVGLEEMIVGLLEDPAYRASAASDIAAIQTDAPITSPEDYELVGREEVRYASALWDEDYEKALSIAHAIADKITTPDLKGYRAWWWYLASLAASLGQERHAEQDALQRGSKCGINTAFLRRLLTDRRAGTPSDAGSYEPNAESIWNNLDSWGWAGPSFSGRLEQMQAYLGNLYHVHFHEGVEALGKALGAQTTRPKTAGAPDVIWSFDNDVHFVFEAKTEKKADSPTLSKRDLLEAKGHVDWVKAHLTFGRPEATIHAVVVSVADTIHSVGQPFAGGLLHTTPEALLAWAINVGEELSRLRVRFSGRDYAPAADEFSAELRAAKIDQATIAAALSTPLKKG